MKRVAVVMGGPGEEHDVSLETGRAVVAGLKAAGLAVVPVWVKRDLSVVFGMPGSDGPKIDIWQAMGRLDAECVFIAMHGTFGEDGVFQAMLEVKGLPFTGSDHVGAAVSMDKVLSKRVYESVGLNVARYQVVESEKYLTDFANIAKELAENIGLPMVVKTPRQGSSKGVALVRDMADLTEQLEILAKMDRFILAEAFIAGREFSVPVLEDAGRLQALPVIEINVHDNGFFDYETKYDPDMVDEVCPAPVSDDLAKRLSDAAILAHEALMLSGFSRSDFIVDKNGGIFILETNAIPGLTPVSLFPGSAAVAGLEFPDLLLKICQSAMVK